jgi:hypothetical protein
MRKLIVSRDLAVILSIALLALIMFPPSSHAYGPGASWQLGFAGTGTLFGSDLGFWGWCTFTGSTSGITGDCQVSQYLHGSVGRVQCETSFDITGWDVKPGVLTPLTGQPDFFITSGSITVRPASATAACSGFLTAAGFHVTQTSPSTLAIVSESDFGAPAVPGHYDFNGLTIAGVDYAEFQMQVTELP